MKVSRAGSCITFALLISGCTPQVEFFDRGDYPERLSAWGMVWQEGHQLVLTDESHVYDLNLPLFSDYALKLRSIYLPPGTSAEFRRQEAFEFPVGTIVTKTFFYPINGQGEVMLGHQDNASPRTVDLRSHELVETRLLIRHADGWDALAYVWRDDDAYLTVTGTLLRLTAAGDDQPFGQPFEQPFGQQFAYLVPSRNQCDSCHVTNHTTGALLPIGLKARHLHRLATQHNSTARRSQLQEWEATGILRSVPALASITANATYASDNLDSLARAYLDINCGHCHNAAGPADTSGLLLDQGNHPMRTLGVCKPPIASGRGSGGRLYSIVPGHPDESILTFRMQTRDPGAMMPEIGRTLVHDEGVRIVSGWIGSLEGECR